MWFSIDTNTKAIQESYETFPNLSAELMPELLVEYPTIPPQDAIWNGNTFVLSPVGELNKAKEIQLSTIKESFIKEANAPVVALNHTWNGGVNSARIINGKADTLTYNGLQSGAIHDIDNLPVTLTVDDIKKVASAISIAYDSIFTLYQQKKVAIKNATTVKDVLAIV